MEYSRFGFRYRGRMRTMLGTVNVQLYKGRDSCLADSRHRQALAMRAITRSRVASFAVESVTNTAIAIRRPSGSRMSPISFVACANPSSTSEVPAL